VGDVLRRSLKEKEEDRSKFKAIARCGVKEALRI
jgi:hypothetical protein